MKTTQLLSAFALLVTSACGSAAGNIHEATAKEILAQDPVGALAQYRLLVGDFDARNSDAECLTLRGKVTGHRDQVRMGSEWRTIVETVPFKALQGIENQFRDGGCKANDPAATEACQVLEQQAQDKAGELAQTPQWQTLANNSYWHDLLGDVRKAQAIECL